MLVAAGLILVFFPAAVALALHDRLVRALDTAGRKWIWYGAYCGIISWIVLAAKFVRSGGGDAISAAFQSVTQLLVYGLVALAAAVILPLFLSFLCVLFGKTTGKEKADER